MGSGLDAVINTEAFRKDHRNVLACNRHQAAIYPVRLTYAANGYKAGTVLARNSVSGLYVAYDDTEGVSGGDTAVGILFNDVLNMPASETDVGQMLVSAQVYESLVIGLDANAKTDLKSRSVIRQDGNTILIF